MAANSISLTAGMRSNLVSLQNTVKLMDQTQERLSSGKKVNSALDDPISYFTAQEHTSRAADLYSLKDGMGEAIQTITAANTGIESMISMIENAKATAESAKSAESAGTGDTTGTLTLTDVDLGNQVTIGGDTYTASTAASATTFVVGDTDELTAMNLATLINSNVEAGANGDIDATSVEGNVINLAVDGDDLEDGDIAIVSDTFTETLDAPADDTALGALVAQYATLMTQLGERQLDAGYKGVNLLNGDDLTVQFEGDHSMTAYGFDGTVDGELGMELTATNSWASADDILADIALMDAAIETLESKASSLASSLSIVTTREDFTTSMINILTEGADNLTLADTNEEGANMLMLQTQQELAISSLSISASSSQAVLKLFS